jgi:hypothetical protein
MRNVWAVVVLVGMSLASITVLALTHNSTAQLMGYITSGVMQVVAMLLIGAQISGQVDQVHQQVNGRMSQLLNKVPDQVPPGGNE